jgi:ABC-type bacteriocin/lantibiotic exporter with double-glycine peptidase domain
MHVYLAPLVMHVGQRRIFDLYRRAALIVLGHLGYSFLLLVLLLIFTLVAVVFLPVYVLIAAALVGLVQAHALREIRRRHGDLAVELDTDRGIGR